MRQIIALVPDYYRKFQCLGTACEENCCHGWLIGIEKATYRRYKQNQHPQLKPLFREAIKRLEDTHQSAVHYAEIRMNAEGVCPFLDEQRLCRIHKLMGAAALGSICRTYPRFAKSLGRQTELSLTLSCPEVARQVLLPQEPMQFSLEEMPEPEEIGRRVLPEGEENMIIALNDLRALMIGILQHRPLSIDARLMLLGLLMESADAVAGEKFSMLNTHLQELADITARFAAMLPQSAAVQAEFDLFPARPELKLMLFQGVFQRIECNQANFLQCLSEAILGLGFTSDSADPALLARYRQAHATWYRPFFDQNAHLLENWLVHQVMFKMFPLCGDRMLTQYQELVCTYFVIRTLLIGMAASAESIDVAMVLRLINALSRLSDHSSSYYMEKITATLREKNLHDLHTLLQLLKEE